jgi:hypothetical protein
LGKALPGIAVELPDRWRISPALNPIGAAVN